MVENWNGANGALFYGKDGELTGSDREHQEVSMLALHLLLQSLEPRQPLRHLPARHGKPPRPGPGTGGGSEPPRACFLTADRTPPCPLGRLRKRRAEEPENLGDLVALMNLHDGEKTTIFASDWPHHDFDHPSKVHQILFANEVRRKVFGENALRLFKIDAQGRRLNL